MSLDISLPSSEVLLRIATMRHTARSVLWILLSALVQVSMDQGHGSANTTPTSRLDIPRAPGSKSTDNRLFDYLFEDYKKEIRPNFNTSQPLTVELGLTFNRIEFLDEKHQTLTFHATTRMRWTDVRLSWKPEEYNKINDISYASYGLWIPDVILANRADPLGSKNFEHVLAHVYSDGQVLLSSPSAFKVYCAMDFGKWPYDIQTCAIEFESFTHDGTQIELQLMPNNNTFAVDVLPYASINEWRVMSVRASKVIKRYECCQGDYHAVYFAVQMQRNQPFYRPLMLTPMVLVLFASWLLFLMPLQSTVKFVIGSFQFIYAAFFAIYLKMTLPPSIEEIPFIVTFTLNVMVLILLALFIEAFLLRISLLKCQMPAAVRNLVLDSLARVCCRKKPSGYLKNSGVRVSNGDVVMDHFEMDTGDENNLIAHKEHDDWLWLASVFNYIAFAIYVLVSFVVLI